MHSDFMHALAVVVALVVTRLVLVKTGIVSQDDASRFSWKMVLAFVVVIFVLNLIWPWQSA